MIVKRVAGVCPGCQKDNILTFNQEYIEDNMIHREGTCPECDCHFRRSYVYWLAPVGSLTLRKQVILNK